MFSTEIVSALGGDAYRRACSLFRAFFFLMIRPPPTSTLFPYTTLFRSARADPPFHLAGRPGVDGGGGYCRGRSEEHTSELQSHHDLVCRLLLEKKNSRRARPIRFILHFAFHLAEQSVVRPEEGQRDLAS